MKLFDPPLDVGDWLLIVFFSAAAVIVFYSLAAIILL